MTLTIDLTPAEEARLAAAARRMGADPADVMRKLVTEHLHILATSNVGHLSQFVPTALWTDISP